MVDNLAAFLLWGQLCRTGRGREQADQQQKERPATLCAQTDAQRVSFSHDRLIPIEKRKCFWSEVPNRVSILAKKTADRPKGPGSFASSLSAIIGSWQTILKGSSRNQLNRKASHEPFSQINPFHMALSVSHCLGAEVLFVCFGWRVSSESADFSAERVDLPRPETSQFIARLRQLIKSKSLSLQASLKEFGSTRPIRMAYLRRSIELLIPSFLTILVRCLCPVLGLISKTPLILIVE